MHACWAKNLNSQLAMKRLFIILALLPLLGAAHAFTTDTLAIATKHLDGAEKVTVIRPDGKPGERFATVYLLNGYGGNHTTWGLVQPRLGELADQYGMIMVMPDGRDSWYWDSPIDPSMQMESFVTQDLVPYIDSQYPTKANAAHRAVTGLSMGGHGALWLAGRHPDIFGNAGSMSGGVDIRPFPKKWKMEQRIGSKEDNPERWDQYTVATMTDTFKNAGLNMIIDCGSDDFFAGVNDKLHHRLLDAGVPHDYTSRPGAHTRQYWANSILYHLLFFKTHFDKAE